MTGSTENPESSSKEMILALKEGVKNLISINDYVDFAYSFYKNGHKITPFQLKNEIKSLLKVLEKINPTTVLEIGTASGGTLFLLCRVASPTAMIISIDMSQGPFGGHSFPEWKTSFYKSFAKQNQSLQLIRSNSHLEETVNYVKKILGEKQLDFLLIDGDHSYEGVKQDYMMYSPLVSKYGMIVLHDITSGPENKVGGVSKFWTEIKSKHDHFEIREGIEGGGFGIGILLNSENTNKMQYASMLKTLVEFQTKRISELTNNPLSALLYLYWDRTHLQKEFPEVKRGDYFRLVKWAANICENLSDEQKFLNSRIMKFSNWYREYLNKKH